MTHYLTIPEAAAALSLHPSTIRKYIRQGELTCVRAPGLVRVPDWAIDEWAERHMSRASSKSRDAESGTSAGLSTEEAWSIVRARRIAEKLSKSETDS